MSCTFCNKSEIKAREIIGNDLAWAFPTNIPITPGHILVAPRRCVPTLEELTNEERLAIFSLADKLTVALKKTYGAAGFNFAWNQGVLAGQSIPHFHLHIISRTDGDEGLLGYDPRSMIYRTGDREPTSEEDLIRIVAQIKSVL